MCVVHPSKLAADAVGQIGPTIVLGGRGQGQELPAIECLGDRVCLLGGVVSCRGDDGGFDPQGQARHEDLLVNAVLKELLERDWFCHPRTLALGVRSAQTRSTRWPSPESTVDEVVGPGVPRPGEHGVGVPVLDDDTGSPLGGQEAGALVGDSGCLLPAACCG